MKNEPTEGMHMRRPMIGVVIAVAAVAIVALTSTRTEALHLKSPLLTQVTDRPSQILDGAHFTQVSNVMMFHSDADLLGNGNTVPQIFVFDTAKRILKHQRAFYQFTNGDQPSLHPSGSPRASTFAYYTAGDPLGNGSVGRQVFTARKVHFKHPEAMKLVQLTKGLGESYDPMVNFSGRYILFTTTGDLNHQNLPAGEHLYRAEPRKLRNAKCGTYPCPFGGDNPGLLLVAPVISNEGVINPAGDQVVFASTADAATNGCVNGAKQLFLRDFKANTIQQLTFGAADSQHPIWTKDGGFIFFESSADLALNGNTRSNIFQIDFSQVPFKLTQITFGTDGDTTDPAPGPGGATRLYFMSTANLDGSGAGVKKLYVIEFHQGGKLYRLSDGQNIDPGIDGNFSFVIFVSDADWLGNGNNTKALYFLNSYRIVGEPFPAPPKPTALPTPRPGDAATMGLALTTNLSEDNGDGTLTTVIAATLGDPFGAPVDGAQIDFSVLAPTNGAVITDSITGADPTSSNNGIACNLVQFQQRTGVPITIQPGKAYTCLTYPREQVNTIRQIKGNYGGVCAAGFNQGVACAGDQNCPLYDPQHIPHGATQTSTTCLKTVTTTDFFTLPAPIHDCSANGVPCNDFNPCTLNDVCGGGTNTCVGGSNAGRHCNNDSQCVTETGGYCELPTCQPGAPKTCADDGNLCTDDTCNFFTGQCYTPKQCFDDGNDCTDDVCDPSTGLCGIPNSEPCSDGNPCTLNDTCSAGSCVPGPVMTCADDGNPCTIDQCNPETGNCGIPGTCACP